MSVETRRPWATRTPLACGCAAVTECRIESACGCALTFVRVGGPRHSHAVYSMRFDALRARPTSLQPLPQVREDAVRLLAQREPAIARREVIHLLCLEDQREAVLRVGREEKVPATPPQPVAPSPDAAPAGRESPPSPGEQTIVGKQVSQDTELTRPNFFLGGRFGERERGFCLVGGGGVPCPILPCKMRKAK